MHLLHVMLAALRQLLYLPALHIDGMARHPTVWATILGGAGLGCAWGALARIWMRLISTAPQFSIAGTAAILTITTLFGACAGLALAARWRGWSGWRH